MTSRSLLYFVTSGLIFARFGPGTTRQKNLRLPVNVIACHELSKQVLRQAEVEAAKIFAQIGISVEWLELQSEGAPHECSKASIGLNLKIVSKTSAAGVSKHGLAFTYWGDGLPATAVVFLNRATSLADITSIPLEIMVGCAIAHELGHVLLGSQTHSTSGLMRRTWTLDDLKKARHGLLGFTDDQAIRDAVERLVVTRDRCVNPDVNPQ